MQSPNVLLCTRPASREGKTGRFVAKIADFGVSCKTMFSAKVQRKQVSSKWSSWQYSPLRFFEDVHAVRSSEPPSLIV